MLWMLRKVSRSPSRVRCDFRNKVSRDLFRKSKKIVLKKISDSETNSLVENQIFLYLIFVFNILRRGKKSSNLEQWNVSHLHRAQTQTDTFGTHTSKQDNELSPDIYWFIQNIVCSCVEALAYTYVRSVCICAIWEWVTQNKRKPKTNRLNRTRLHSHDPKNKITHRDPFTMWYEPCITAVLWMRLHPTSDPRYLAWASKNVVCAYDGA